MTDNKTDKPRDYACICIACRLGARAAEVAEKALADDSPDSFDRMDYLREARALVRTAMMLARTPGVMALQDELDEQADVAALGVRIVSARARRRAAPCV